MKKKSKNNNLLLISLHRKILLNNYQKSVEKLVSTKKLKKYDLREITQKEKNIGIWGIVNTEDNYKIWKKIKKSDTIIFLHNKKFFSKAKVIAIKEDNELPLQIWKNISFIENRNLLIFLEKIEPIELEYDACIPTLIEPNMSNAYFFPIMKISDKKKNLLVTTFGNLENAIDFLGNPESKNSSISDYLTEGELSEEVPITIKSGINKQRIGQQKFRKNILLNFGYKCAVCGISDIELLEAAHIIPIEDKNLAGKTNNGICLCSNCHKMFDNGFFSFNEKYKVVISKKKKISNKIFAMLKNQNMGKYKISPAKEYLGLHRTKFGIKD